MKNLFEPAAATEIKNRIEQLQANSQKQWGKMTVAQMLAHCSASIEMAAGINIPPRSFIGRIFGKLAKRSMLSEAPVGRNMPTDKSLLMQGEKDFAKEKRRLIECVDQFSSGGAEKCITHPHSFFGPMTPQEWAVLSYKHLDHHLKQFGV